MDSVVCWWGF